MANRKRSFFSRLTFSTVCLFLAGLMVLSYLSMLVDPSRLWVLTMFGIIYLPLSLVTLLFFLWSLFRGSKMSGLLLLVLLPALFMSGRFVRFSGNGEEVSEDDIHMISYNVCAFYYNPDGKMNMYDMEARMALAERTAEFIMEENADIVCLQEFFLPRNVDVKTWLSKHFPGYEASYFMNPGHLGMSGNVTLSRFPMENKGRVKFSGTANMAIYADLNIRGTKLRLYNCHYQSYSISLPRIIKSFGTSDNAVEDAELKMKKAIPLRAAQVEQVLEDMASCPHRSMLAGDFNDTPMSYTYHRLIKGRKDAFVKAGKGLGATYSGFYPLLRIDYIMYPEENLAALSCDIKRVKYSDHYPVMAAFRLKDDD